MHNKRRASRPASEQKSKPMSSRDQFELQLTLLDLLVGYGQNKRFVCDAERYSLVLSNAILEQLKIFR